MDEPIIGISIAPWYRVASAIVMFTVGNAYLDYIEVGYNFNSAGGVLYMANEIRYEGSTIKISEHLMRIRRE